MTAGLSQSVITRLEKVATDNGFDRELPPEIGWLGFASTQAPLRIWLTAVGENQFWVAFSQSNVARSLGVDSNVSYGVPMPPGTHGASAVSDIPALHRVVRRAFQLSKALPDELLHVFDQKIASLPRTTEAERLVVQRLGQEVFRSGLIEYWEGRCVVTGLAVVSLLRASHIKPWAACASDSERLDVFNGLLLAPNLDAMFDCGLMTVADDGALLLSEELKADDCRILGLDSSLRVRRLDEAHRTYLAFHREHVFRSKSAKPQNRIANP
jgi:putative restriction endonuclease